MKKTETKSTVLLHHHLKALRLPTVAAECEAIAARCATDNVDHLGFLLQLCERELLDRERRAADRRLKAAKFPTLKTLDDFDFAAQPSLNKVLVAELMRGSSSTAASRSSWSATRAPGRRTSPPPWPPRRVAAGRRCGSTG